MKCLIKVYRGFTYRKTNVENLCAWFTGLKFYFWNLLDFYMRCYDASVFKTQHFLLNQAKPFQYYSIIYIKAFKKFFYLIFFKTMFFLKIVRIFFVGQDWCCDTSKLLATLLDHFNIWVLLKINLYKIISFFPTYSVLNINQF